MGRRDMVPKPYLRKDLTFSNPSRSTVFCTGERFCLSGTKLFMGGKWIPKQSLLSALSPMRLVEVIHARVNGLLFLDLGHDHSCMNLETNWSYIFC